MAKGFKYVARGGKGCALESQPLSLVRRDVVRQIIGLLPAELSELWLGINFSDFFECRSKCVRRQPTPARHNPIITAICFDVIERVVAK